MAIKKWLCFAALAFSPLAVSANEIDLPPLAPLNFKAQYAFGFGGLNFGKVGVDAQQSATATDITADVMSTGIVNMFIKHSSHTTMHAKGAGVTYAMVDYESHYQTKKKRKYAHMVYKKGVVVEENVLPPDNRQTRPAVLKASKDQSVDPLTLIMAMRQKLYDAIRKGETTFSINYYDGRRLSQVNFAIVGEENVMTGNEKKPVIQVDVSRELLEGFTASELESAQKKDPPLHVYFSHDARLVPLLFEAPMWVGSVFAIFKRECGAHDSCLLGIKE